MPDMLIVIDMQRDFVSGALGSAQARAIVPAIAARIRRAKEEGTQVLFTLDTHKENYAETREGRHLPVPHCISGTPGWTLEPEIAAERTDGMPAFEKPTFGSVTLMHHIARWAASHGAPDGRGLSIELCGVCTDICVISNALLLHAALPEADLAVSPALTAGTSPERHEAALAVMQSCQIRML